VVSALAVCAFALNALAQKQSEKPKTPSKHETLPYWAYAVYPPVSASGAPAKPVDGTPRQVPGSSATFTPAQVEDFFNPPDWHPSGHPAMPEIVAHGRKPNVYACGYCHLPNGQGRPENSNLTGLPVPYIIQQMADFKSGLRKSSEPKHLPVATMIANETMANEVEIQAAAEYFSGMKLKPWIRVVETKTVPKTHVAGWMLVPSGTGENEPIGQRIIEMPENLERTEPRDDASGFVAYTWRSVVSRKERHSSGLGVQGKRFHVPRVMVAAYTASLHP
jgi:cytochrome c553